MTITPAASHSLTWSAGTSGNWDWNNTANWNNGTGSDKYYDLDAVTFGTQSAATTIKIVNNISGAAGGFYPSSVTVNSDTDYTLASNSASVDRISGPATLYKDGTGTLTISMSNDYSGTTTIHAGVIKLSNTGALGSGTLVIQNGGTMDLNHQAIGGKAITVQGAGVNQPRAQS